MLQFIDIQGESLLVIRRKQKLKALYFAEECIRTLYDALDSSNAIYILEVASRLDISQLIDKSRAVALWNFDEISQLDVFYHLSVDQVEGSVLDIDVHINL